jgi:hypothetical protein
MYFASILGGRGNEVIAKPDQSDARGSGLGRRQRRGLW